MKNLLISAIVTGALVCPVVNADDTMGSPAAPAEAVAPAHEDASSHEAKPATKHHEAKKQGKRHGKKRHHGAKGRKKHAHRHHHKQHKSETAAEKKIDQETELNNH